MQRSGPELGSKGRKQVKIDTTDKEVELDEQAVREELCNQITRNAQMQIEAGELAIRDLINELPLQEPDLIYLNKLKVHMKLIYYELNRAKLRAYGSGQRDARGFKDTGCGCSTCRQAVETWKTKLRNAKKKYESEYLRVRGISFHDTEPL
jgi:hypothetical protein